MLNPFEILRGRAASAPSLYVLATGAGAGLQQLAWAVPGASAFFAGAGFPYVQEDTQRVLGFVPEAYVSKETALDLALAAYVRAWTPGRSAIGLGLTCSVASAQPHRGEHRIVAAVFTESVCSVVSTVIPKGEGAVQRLRDGSLADSLGMALVSYAIGDCDAGRLLAVASGRGNPTDFVDEALSLARARLLSRPWFRANGSRSRLAELPTGKTVFLAGAFNPPHAAHFGAAQKAVETLALRCGECRAPVFSTTINPPHKDALSVAQMLQRIRLMEGRDFVLTEDDPLFLDKARRFPGAHFIMGADALIRFLDPKWGQPVRQMLAEFERLHTKFLIPGRLVEGAYVRWEQVRETFSEHVQGFEHLFIPVDYRLDMSSSQIRAQQQH